MLFNHFQKAVRQDTNSSEKNKTKCSTTFDADPFLFMHELLHNLPLKDLPSKCPIEMACIVQVVMDDALFIALCS